MKIFKGIPVSPGIVVHQVKTILSESFPFPDRFISDDKIDNEIERYQSACRQAKENLDKTKIRVSESIGQDFAEIFDSHKHILEDETIQKDTELRIRNNLFSAEYAVTTIFKKYKKMFQSMGKDSVLSQRVADIDDIERRLLKILMGVTGDISKFITKDAVYVARSLRPSQAVILNNKFVKGVATELGGATSHFSIMLRAVGLPGIVGVEGLTKELVDDQTIILDGHTGHVILDPDEVTLEKYEKLQIRFQAYEDAIIKERHLPAETIDGFRVSLFGNIEFPTEAKGIIQNGGEGIGLYRTEFLFVDTEQFPNEKQHYNAYEAAAKDLKGRPFVIRTMDLGADKFADVTGADQESNPFLGCRSIRFCYENPSILITQLKAILRASVLGNIKILFPMISSIEELKWALNQLDIAKHELTIAGVKYAEKIPVGIMVEVPSIAIIADDIAPLVDFFSIGTNDLIQYTLAVDRDNKSVSRLYSASHPAVLKLIKMTIDAANRYNIDVCLCGEMASNPAYIPILIGFGLTEFSISSHSIPFIKNLIRKMTYSKIQEITNDVMFKKTSKDIYNYLSSEVRDLMPDYYSESV
ncbi:MAG: phosphoenolpyruvate--protein phosphotransferase [Planctomycetota bacterium]|nr:MAG: phosphoenolpyruvate--protein phosphotransferase [Planctomycetota bacterium]